jgi:hypothetical protein
MNEKVEDASLPEPPRCGLEELPPADLIDPVVEVYKQHVDRTLLMKNLSLTPTERLQKLADFVRFVSELRREQR